MNKQNIISKLFLINLIIICYLEFTLKLATFHNLLSINSIYIFLFSIMFAIILTLLFPSITFAYSNKVILGGDNVGIKVNSKYVMIVGFYKVNNTYIGEDAGLKIGDFITKINNIEVNSINEMIDIINNLENKESINITYLRDNKELETKLNLVKDSNNIYKTGLYVKDQISGIGTLTYVDPITGIFGAVGHEISEKNTFKNRK